LTASSQLPQAAISSIVRRQPAHQPVAASIVHTLVQGLGISDAIDDEAYAATARRAKTRILLCRGPTAQYVKRA
jgi:hypothetical protein